MLQDHGESDERDLQKDLRVHADFEDRGFRIQLLSAFRDSMPTEFKSLMAETSCLTGKTLLKADDI